MPLSKKQLSQVERAQLALRAFRVMLPGLTSYARAVTGRPALQVKPTAGAPHTDGNDIFFRPPIALADDIKHDRRSCDQRDPNTMLQMCKACAIREDILVSIYHEIAHIIYHSFRPYTNEDRKAAIAKGIALKGDAFGKKMAARLDQYPVDPMKRSYMALAGSMSQYLPPLVNITEDIRIDNKMYEARQGIRRMREGRARRAFTDGVEGDNGELVMWSTAPLNAQFAVAVYAKAAGFEMEGYFAEEVIDAFATERVAALAESAKTAKSASDTFNIAYELLVTGKELGFFKEDSDPEPEEDQQPEPEDQSSDDKQDDTESGDNESDDDEGGPDSEQTGPDNTEESSSQDGENDGPEQVEDESDDETGAGPVPEQEVPSTEDGSEPHEGHEDEGPDDGPPASDSGDDGGEQRDERDDDAGNSGEESDDDSSEEPGGESGEESPSDEDLAEAPAEAEGDSADDPSDAAESDRDAAGIGNAEVEGSDESESAKEIVPQDSEPDDSKEDVDDQASDGSGSDQSEPAAQDASGGESGEEGQPSEDNGDGMGQPELEGGADGHAESGATDPDADQRGENAEDSSWEDGTTEPSDTGSAVPDEAQGWDDAEEPVDSGAYDEDMAAQTDQPDYGTAEGIPEFLEAVTGHHGDHEVDSASEDNESDDNVAMARAILQGAYFESPPQNVIGVNVRRYDKPDTSYEDAWRGTNGGYIEPKGITSYPESALRKVGVRCDTNVPESVLGKALLVTRRALNDNARASHQRNMKSGRVNGPSLGKRAPLGDPRMFKRTVLPGKKSYSVLIGIDISGSTVGVNIVLAKRAAKAQAELCQRAGIDFAIYAHSADKMRGGLALDIYEIKSFGELWNDKTKEAFDNIGSHGGNLDGHTIEFYRKVIEREQSTDKIILYYTDGKMPASNYEEELAVLQRQIAHCKRQRIALMGVGIRTDSPIRHGLDTVQVDSDEDLIKVVRHLEKMLVAR